MSKYWPLSSRAYKVFKTSGSDNSGDVVYTYNEEGFRGDSVDEDIDMVAIGCSHTEGIGVNDNETWPFYVASSLGINHINMGFTGRSNDYISRMTIKAVKQYRPKFISVMYTYPVRRELPTKYGFQPFAANPWGYFEDFPEDYKALTQLSSQLNDKRNWEKNHLLIDSICKLYNTNLVWNGTFADVEEKDQNRYDGEYKIEIGKHATPIQNQKYAEGLVGFLKDNSYI